MRGLFDLHGNLLEWTHDWYDDFDVEIVTDPEGPSRGSYRVKRGGSWGSVAANCRSAFRGSSVPTHRSNVNGFRLALSPSGVSKAAEQVQGAEPEGGGKERVDTEQRPRVP
jgi:formylglycine-generating enzyme required for sulfatase activity